MAEASGDGVQIGACGEELGSGVVSQFLHELVMPILRAYRRYR